MKKAPEVFTSGANPPSRVEETTIQAAAGLTPESAPAAFSVSLQGQDKKTLKRIDLLIEVSARELFYGIGKREPLLGYWSRRIEAFHRLVYAVEDAALDVIACLGHYND